MSAPAATSRSAPTGRRTWLLILAGLAVATLTSVWLGSGSQAFPGRLDPQNPEPEGGQALARVLGAQGVDVEVARSAAELDGADLGAATGVVTSTDLLGASTVRRLVAAVGDRPVILVEPPAAVAELLGFDAAPTPADDGDRVPAQCADPRLNDLEISAFEASGYPAGPRSCFPAAELALWAPQDETVAFLGFGDALTNDQITDADNAAAGLRLLGSSERLVWYVPDLADLSAGDEVGLGSLLPPWLVPALWLLGLALVALALTRGRRLGPLVSEPLPVVVKAVETTLSRGRLYRKARDRRHAAGVLRAAARVGAAERLRLPRRHDERALLADVARHTGQDPAVVERLLSSRASPPATDRDLAALAGELADLDDSLRKAPR